MLALLSALMVSSTAPNVLSYPRQSRGVAVVLNAPSGRAGQVTRSEILRELSDQLRRSTDFELSDVDASVVSRCAGKLACIVLDVRRDYNRVTPRDPRELESRNREYPPFLLVLTHLTHEAMTERLSVLLVDTQKALIAIHEADREKAEWESDVEAAILSASVETSADLRTRNELQPLMKQAVEVDFAPAFKARNFWRQLGVIEVVTEVDRAAIQIDDVVIGPTAGGITRIEEVPVGRHQVKLEHPTHHVVQTEVEVATGEAARIEATFVRRKTAFGRTMNDVVLWGGVATSLIGAGLVVYALAAPKEVGAFCINSQGECDGGEPFRRFGEGADGPFTGGNGSGPPIAPLGYALFGAGATWALGTWLFESDVPWIQLVAGAAVFGIAYGVSIALDSSDPAMPQ